MIKPEDIEVPEGMKEKVEQYWREVLTTRNPHISLLPCVLAALANNPIVPTDEEVEEMLDAWTLTGKEQSSRVFLCTEWQRRMFLRKRNPLHVLLESAPRVARDAVLAAYELGKAEGK